MINPSSMMKLMNFKKKFESNHPKFAAFLGNIFSKGLDEGTIIEITVQRPNEAPMTTNMKISRSDLELIEELKELK